MPVASASSKPKLAKSVRTLPPSPKLASRVPAGTRSGSLAPAGDPARAAATRAATSCVNRAVRMGTSSIAQTQPRDRRSGWRPDDTRCLVRRERARAVTELQQGDNRACTTLRHMHLVLESAAAAPFPMPPVNGGRSSSARAQDAPSALEMEPGLSVALDADLSGWRAA